jgi:hypothetical protein
VVVIKQQTMNILESPAFANHIVVESGDEAEIARIKNKL